MKFKSASQIFLGVFFCTVLVSCSGQRASNKLTGSCQIRHGNGPVRVFYAGSLAEIFNGSLGPVFTATEGFQFQGYPGGSNELANEMNSGLEVADVFISAANSVQESLFNKKLPDETSFYLVFATDPLVIAYNPHSRYATDFKTRPWIQVITSSNIQIGRTDPKLDPKGALTIEMLQKADTYYRKQDLVSLAQTKFPEFPEETLVGRLQSGQLDAAFLYLNEAVAAKLPYVKLNPLNFGATYSLSIPKNAPDYAGALAFSEFLFQKAAISLFSKNGIILINPPKLVRNNAYKTVPACITRLAING